MKLDNKVALVTGAAGQLGKQFCQVLAKEGAEVWVSDLNFDSCERVKNALCNPSKHSSICLDVSNKESVRSAIMEIEKQSKRLDILVNNAGIQVFTPFEERTFDEFMNVLKVNTGGAFLCIQEATKLMRELGICGSIINIGSIYGIVSGDPRIYTDCARTTSECYGISKAAVIYMSKYFAVHLAKYNIRVNCISPGGVFNDQGEDFVRNYSYRTPMGRMANEADMGGALIFLASDNSAYMTGQNLVIDGGWTAW